MLIRNKLILRFTGLALLIQLGLSGFVYWFSVIARAQRFRDRLAGEAALAARLLVREHHLDRAYLRRFHPREVPNLVGEEVSLFDLSTGEHLYFGAAPGGRESRADHARYFRQWRARPAGTRNGQNFRSGPRETLALPYTDDATGRAYLLLAGGYDDDGHRQLRRLGLLLLVGNVGALVLIVLAGWYFADEALRPVAHMVRQARRITAARLSQRLDEGNRADELAQLAITFNQMLTRLEDAFERQRTFVAHASHELRTPLTALRGTLETAVAYDPTLPDAQASMRLAIEEAEKLIALTNALLTLAQADARAALPPTAEARLDECLLEALAAAHQRHPGLAVSLTLADAPTDLPAGSPADSPPGSFVEAVADRALYSVRGHAALLTTALLNLLDNAGKYGAPPVLATIAYAAPDGAGPATVRVTVRDHGPGLPPAELARAAEPLFRGEATRTTRPGFGLGLAVVARVAELHGGTLTLAAPPDGGLEATLALPACRPGPWCAPGPMPTR